MTYKYILGFLILSVSLSAYSQDPKRFQGEIDAIDSKFSGKVSDKELIVFTGSSSVRRWTNISEYFPGKNIINTGFGGSQMSDLLYYADNVITRYRPVQVFIYEGDNDLNAGKKADQIISDTRELILKIRKDLPEINIVLIAAKPSPSRWALREEYLKLNTMYRQLTSEFRNTGFADVWNPLLNSKGVPKHEIYISDSLHLNGLGYDIWAEIIRNLLK